MRTSIGDVRGPWTMALVQRCHEAAASAALDRGLDAAERPRRWHRPRSTARAARDVGRARYGLDRLLTGGDRPLREVAS